MSSNGAAAALLWLITVYLIFGAALALATVNRARRPLGPRETLAVAGVRMALALIVAGIALWVAW